MRTRRFLVALVAAVAPAITHAAADEQTAWGAWFATTALQDRWSLTSDVQLRTADDRDGLRNTLLRGGLTWRIDDRRNATAGYAWIGTHANRGPDLVEHRLWQQFVVTDTLAGAAVQHRFRLEQRFVEPRPGAERLFSQRARYFVRGVKPLRGTGGAFREGPFFALQNEVFLTVQQAANTNGRLFDQNRAYAALGWRIERRFDIELGYLNQHVQRRGDALSNHVLQLAFYSRLP